MGLSYTRQSLSGSTNDKPIPVAAIATPGTLIHTAIGGTINFDELYLWVSNVTAAAVKLTLEWGGVTDPGDHLVKQLSVPPNSPPTPLVTGQIMRNGLVIRGFADVASALNISGYVNRAS